MSRALHRRVTRLERRTSQHDPKSYLNRLFFEPAFFRQEIEKHPPKPGTRAAADVAEILAFMGEEKARFPFGENLL
ncbi:hypothetical protein [Geothrix terrae]|uniref:hypothetical protein n=1 Tax=Geothrix terrae TaxID=2922720 RepID=UPI001FAB742E|nr:hypothetical protein [Geothrix terrae]